MVNFHELSVFVVDYTPLTPLRSAHAKRARSMDRGKSATCTRSQSSCGGSGSQELVGGGLTSARRTAPNGQAGTQDRHPRHRLASMAGRSPRSNWTSAWGLQAVRAWQVVHVWQTCRSTRKMGRIIPRWCSILSYRHRARIISRAQSAFAASPPIRPARWPLQPH